MKKIVYYTIIAGLFWSCGNSKKAAEEVVETKTVEEPTDPAVPQLYRAIETSDPAENTERISNEKKPEQTYVAIEWLDFETAIELNKDNPKYILIDVYTEWCGWCKKMDASTFVDPNVAAYVSEHFYAVKMDAEMKEAIAYNGQLYEHKQFTEKSGYNTLAVNLLDSQMSFPSFVVLNQKEVKKGKIMGYKTADIFLMELRKYVK